MFEMFKEGGVKTSATSPSPKNHQFSLPHIFWAAFVVGIYCSYWRLLALTCRCEMQDVALSTAAALGAAVLLAWDPRTLASQLAFAAPFLAFFPILFYLVFVDGKPLNPIFMNYLKITPFFAFLGGCFHRFSKRSELNVALTTLLMLIVFLSFFVGMMQGIPRE